MYKLSIVTAEQTIYEGEIASLVAPGANGEFGILTNHHPIVTKLAPGGIKITKNDGTEEMLFTSGGYLEFNENKAIILSDVIENVEAIQAEQAASARKEAQERLKHAKDEVEKEKLEAELQLNMIRERLAGMSRFRKKSGAAGGNPGTGTVLPGAGA